MAASQTSRQFNPWEGGVVPEGDTIFRTASSLRSWLLGRTITAATARNPRVAIGRLVGRRLTDVSTHGKHLFLEFQSPDGLKDAAREESDMLVLRTHMMMTGSWHVYREGDRWRKPARQAVVALAAGDRTAVCFNAPVVELVSKKRSAALRNTNPLGPDILGDPLDVDGIIRRSRLVDRTTPIGVVLLNQHVVAGIGNIYRCESLHLEGLHPRMAMSTISDEALEALIRRAADLMRANLLPTTGPARDLGGGPNAPWVYGRTGRPCRRCGATVVSERLGAQPRTAYWCPTCQPTQPTAPVVPGR